MEWELHSFFFTHVSSLASLDSIVIHASGFMPTFPLRENYSPWRGWKIPLSCNQSCCLFSCQTWGPWVLRSLSLLAVPPSLPKRSPSLMEQHMRVGLVYTSSRGLFRQAFPNEAEHKLSGGPPVTQDGSVSCPICSSRVDVPHCAVGFWGGAGSNIPHPWLPCLSRGCQNTLAAASHTGVQNLGKLINHMSRDTSPRSAGRQRPFLDPRLRSDKFNTTNFLSFDINLTSFLCDRSSYRISETFPHVTSRA